YPLDYDNDGDLDLLEVRNGDAPILWEATTDPGAGWLQVEVLSPAGTPDQRQALVAVRAQAGDNWRIETIGQNSTFLGHGELMATFGFGHYDGVIDAVRVCWPDLGL